MGESERGFVKFCSSMLALLLLLLPGCSPKPAQAPTPAAPSWSWDRYPETERMKLAILPSRVMPKTSLAINAPLTGVLRLYVDRPQTNLPAGFIWGEFEPKILKAESEALNEAKQKLDQREQYTFELELPKQKIKLAKEIEEGQRQLALMEAMRQILSSNITVAPSLVNLTGLKDQSFKPESLLRAREELRVMKENYRYLCETNLTALGVDLEGQRLEWKHRQLEFERQQNQAQFKMPFNGQLNPSLQMAEGVIEYPVNAGQELAIARDLSVILLRVPMAEASWSTFPAEDLTALLSLPDGKKLNAAFAFKKLERFQAREEVVYYFQFPTNGCVTASRLLGTDVSCELWIALSRPARVVPKLALVLHQPALFQNRLWNEGITQLCPGARLLVEGQTDLAIVVPDKSGAARDD